MRLTGLHYLDAAIQRYSLYAVAHSSPIQQCCEVTTTMTREDVIQALRTKHLLPLPYCISQAIESFQNRHTYPSQSHSLFVHRISLPNNEALCWMVIDDKGTLLEQAHCKYHGYYPEYCRLLVAHVCDISRKPNRRVA